MLPADGADAKFPAGNEASLSNPPPTCHSVGRFGPAREEIAMRDPALAAAKGDIRQQAIKGGEVPGGDIQPPAIQSPRRRRRAFFRESEPPLPWRF